MIRPCSSYPIAPEGSDAVIQGRGVLVGDPVFQEKALILQLISQRQAEGPGIHGFCVFTVLKKEGHAAVSPCGPLKLHILAETVLWQAVFASVYHDPVIPAASNHGKEERRTAVPEARIPLPDVFFPSAVF